MGVLIALFWMINSINVSKYWPYFQTDNTRLEAIKETTFYKKFSINTIQIHIRSLQSKQLGLSS